MKATTLVLLISLVLINSHGCSPAGVLASGGAGTMVVAEGDRSMGSVVGEKTARAIDY